MLGVDFIAPEGYGEVIGGGQRIHDLDLLLQRLKEHNLPAEAFNSFNTPHFSGLDTSVNSPTFGRITSVGSMRKANISLRYRF